jgi:hypothetical protein
MYIEKELISEQVRMYVVGRGERSDDLTLTLTLA